MVLEITKDWIENTSKPEKVWTIILAAIIISTILLTAINQCHANTGTLKILITPFMNCQ